MASPTTLPTEDLSLSDPSTTPKTLDFALPGLKDVVSTPIRWPLYARPVVFPTKRLVLRSGSVTCAPSNLTELLREIEDWLGRTVACDIGTFARDEVVENLIEIPTGVDKRHEPLIKGKGVPVWILVSYATKRGMSAAEISGLWNGYVTKEEVRAALAYWQAHPENVEDKLSDAE